MFTRRLRVRSALYQSMNTNYMVRESKGKEKPHLPPCWSPQTLFFSSEVDLHYMFVWSLTFEKQAVKYERARTGELKARLFQMYRKQLQQ